MKIENERRMESLSVKHRDGGMNRMNNEPTHAKHKMIGKNDGRRFISPRLSIVDGTHLCLLPPLSCYDAESGSGHDGRGSNETKHTDGNNDKLQNMDEDEDDVDRIITVPALPLSLFRNIYDGEYMSCLVEDGDAHMTCANNQKATTSAEKESS